MVNCELNVVCPEGLKRYIIRSNMFKHPHFFTKEDVMTAVVGGATDADILKYADEEALSWASSKKQFQEFSYFKKTAGQGEVTHSIEELLNRRKTAVERGYLKEADYLLGVALKKRHVVVIGYTENDTDLIEALVELGIEDYEIMKHEVSEKRKIEVSVFDEAWVEVMYGMSELCERLNKRVSEGAPLNLNDVKIICPADYFDLVQSTATLFNLPVSIPVDSIRNIPEAKEFVDNIDSWEVDALEEKVNRIKNAVVKSLVTKALVVLTQVKDIRPELKREYLLEVLNKPFAYQGENKSISVQSNLAGASPSSLLLVLGFSSSLVSSAKDNGMISDLYKPSVTFRPTTVSANKISENRVRMVLSLSDEVIISRSNADKFKEYKPVFFLGKADWIQEKAASERKKYICHGAYDGEARKDLAFYNAIFHDRYDQIYLKDELAINIFSSEKDSFDKYCSYDNDFDDDPATQEYFKKMFAGTITLSHSTLDTYQNDPFAYYCTKVLGLSTPSNFQTLAGQLLHSHMENRKGFDCDAMVDKLINRNPEVLVDMCKEQFVYYLKNANKVLVTEDIVPIESVEDFLGWKQVHPSNGKDEFGATIDMPFNTQLKVFFDQIYITDKGQYVLVDYKTSKTVGNYVSFFETLLGRKMQLPLYSVAFDQLKKQYPELSQSGELEGSYICSIPYATPYVKPFGNTFVGYKYTKDKLYDADKATEELGITKRTNLINCKNEIKKFDSKDELTKEWKEYVLLKGMDDQATEGLSFGLEADMMYPNGTPATSLIDENNSRDLIYSMALTTYFSVVNYLRNGRITIEDMEHPESNKIKWFPVYPSYYLKNGRLQSVGQGFFDDISYVKPAQRHLLAAVDKVSKGDVDFDRLDILSAEDDDEENDDADNQEED